MASQDNYFVVRKGIGVGTLALYADGDTKTVSIGKTTANYSLDVVGDVYSSDAVYAQNNLGVNTTSNFQTVDVIGSAYISNSVGIATTNPTQRVQVGSTSTQSVVITSNGYVGVSTLTPSYNLDVFGNARITGFATINQSYTGIATIAIGSITDAYIGIATVGFATINRSFTGIATIGFASITDAYIGVATVGFATITQERVGISTIDFLNVLGITTTANLDVGVGGTILKASAFDSTITTVPTRDGTRSKTNTPLTGIGTILPTSTLDVAGDIRIRGEVFDSNNNVGYAYSVLASSGDGELVWNPPGARIGNEYFVNKLGDDDNFGMSPGDAFLTIKKACSVAEPGDTIRVFAGLYVEDGPIQVPERVAVVGEDLRRTLVTTSGPTDLYHVRRGCYISQQSFVGPSNPGKAMVSFPTQGNGYANGTEQDWQSPYVQNCTNFVPDSIGMRIDGNRAGGFKSMVLDAYTQYNQGGIGVSITNFGYAQLVSLFTICCDIAVYCDSGGVCDLNNSNSSFGNFGLVSDGATPLQYVGSVAETPDGDDVDSLVVFVGVGASTQFRDTVDLLRLNKEFIATEAVGFLTSTDGPYGANGPNFDYGGSIVGRSKCIRDGQIIIESICSDILTLGNGNSINAGLAYRDSSDGSLTYLNDSDPVPSGFSAGYVKDGEVAIVEYIAGISTYVAQNLILPTSYQSGVGSVAQTFDVVKGYSSNVEGFISNRAGIITSIVGLGTGEVPALELPKGQRPYDGQISYIGSQYYFVSRVDITNPGYGYSDDAPVEVTIDFPASDNFIPAEAAIFETNIGAGGTITAIDVIVSGTGYSATPPTVTISNPPAIGPGIGTTATAVAVMEKYFFNPISATPVDENGNTTVTFDEFITYPVTIGDSVYFYQSSKIIASSITFEYIGTGTDIVNAVPSKGAVPIDENQIVATNGGKVPFTSTDQSGDFRISEGITINQNTGTISGQAFSKSLQAEVTPLIIALQQ
jgi:hypothetical protein